MGFRIDPSTVAKTVSAFLAGLVLVLGGALIYSRAQEPIHPLKVVPAAPIAAPTPVEDQNVPEDEAPATVLPPAKHPSPKMHPLLRTHPKLYSVAQVRTQLPTSQPVPPTRLIATASGAGVIVPPVTNSAPPPESQRAPQTEPRPAPQPEPQTQPQPEPQYTPAPVVARPQPHVITLGQGTSLVVRLGETVSSDHNSTGDTFRGTLDLPIIANGFVIADRGSVILGRVIYAQRASLMGGSADLILRLTEINTTDGQLVRIDTNPWEQRGPDMKIRNAPKALFGAAVGAVEGALSGASQGAGFGDAFSGSAGTNATNQRALVLSVDTRIPFRLARPLTITEKLNGG